MEPLKAKSFAYFLKKIDIFGRKTELNIKNESKYKTTIGGIFTLIMISLCVLLFVNFGSDMLYHMNPTTVYSQVYAKNPKKTQFSKENYFFMFGVENPSYAHFIDETIYTIKVTNKRTSKVGGVSFIKNVTIERCTDAHLPDNQNMYDYFRISHKSIILCKRH